MFVDNFWYYALASFMLLLGHVIRAVRWALLFPKHQIDKRFNLLLALSLGYAINAIFPWRLGELARIWFVARRESIRISSVSTTVVGERLSDLVAVSVIALIILISIKSSAWIIPLIPIAFSLFLIVVAFLVKKSAEFRRVIWKGASIFNNRLRFGVVDFFWTLSEMITGGTLLARRFVGISVVMWTIYILSYAAFAHAAGRGFDEMIFVMLGSPLKAGTDQAVFKDTTAALTLLGFTGFPVIGILVYGGIKQFPTILRLLNARRRYGWYANRGILNGSRNRFKAEREYEFFLVSLFSGDNKIATSFGLEAIDDGSVNKLFAGGSDAITALVEVDQRLVIRKFAVGAAAEKLKAQHDWLARYRSKTFPLVDIIRDKKKNGSYHYDMPFIVPSNDFYDFIHTNPVERSQKVISQIIERISSFHNEHSRESATELLIQKYIQEKAIANVNSILDFAKTVFSNQLYTINNIEFDLKKWECLRDINFMSRQIRNRSITIVHGDLTIENIIVAPLQDPNWYIIDPNPENVFNCSLIDWAKLMQSVNLGYEGLNRNFGCIVNNNSIQLAFTKSQAYSELHQLVESLIVEKFGPDGLREVYFHELIHYLRLTPYKIRQDAKKGMCFFACSSILLHRYLNQAV
jgi:Lysylphosphatidylglycerol synthase TM region